MRWEAVAANHPSRSESWRGEESTGTRLHHREVVTFSHLYSIESNPPETLAKGSNWRLATIAGRPLLSGLEAYAVNFIAQGHKLPAVGLSLYEANE